MLGVTIVLCHEYYLGLPTNARTDKQKMFRDIKNSCVEHNSWLGNHVDVYGNKEVLKKFACHAIMSYPISAFSLLVSICYEIQDVGGRDVMVREFTGNHGNQCT